MTVRMPAAVTLDRQPLTANAAPHRPDVRARGNGPILKRRGGSPRPLPAVPHPSSGQPSPRRRGTADRRGLVVTRRFGPLCHRLPRSEPTGRESAPRRGRPSSLRRIRVVGGAFAIRRSSGRLFPAARWSPRSARAGARGPDATVARALGPSVSGRPSRAIRSVKREQKRPTRIAPCQQPSSRRRSPAIRTAR